MNLNNALTSGIKHAVAPKVAQELAPNAVKAALPEALNAVAKQAVPQPAREALHLSVQYQGDAAKKAANSKFVGEFLDTLDRTTSFGALDDRHIFDELLKHSEPGSALHKTTKALSDRKLHIPDYPLFTMGSGFETHVYNEHPASAKIRKAVDPPALTWHGKVVEPDIVGTGGRDVFRAALDNPQLSDLEIAKNVADTLGRVAKLTQATQPSVRAREQLGIELLNFDQLRSTSDYLLKMPGVKGSTEAELHLGHALDWAKEGPTEFQSKVKELAGPQTTDIGAPWNWLANKQHAVAKDLQTKATLPYLRAMEDFAEGRQDYLQKLVSGRRSLSGGKHELDALLKYSEPDSSLHKAASALTHLHERLPDKNTYELALGHEFLVRTYQERSNDAEITDELVRMLRNEYQETLSGKSRPNYIQDSHALPVLEFLRDRPHAKESTQGLLSDAIERLKKEPEKTSQIFSGMLSML